MTDLSRASADGIVSMANTIEILEGQEREAADKLAPGTTFVTSPQPSFTLTQGPPSIGCEREEDSLNKFGEAKKSPQDGQHPCRDSALYAA